jgi:hypothetical protein
MQDNGAMAAFVLVHSPLVGPYTWAPVADLLRERGHAAAVPVLSGCEAPYWRNHVQRIVEAARGLDAAPLTLVAHSGAGPLLPLAADALNGRAHICIYADAMLPTGGASRMDTLPPTFANELQESVRDGLVPAWGESWPESLWRQLIPRDARRRIFRTELQPTPLAISTEAIPEARTTARSAYLQFSDSYADEAAAARAPGWPVRHLAGGHLHMLADPEAVVEALLELNLLP